MPVIIAFLLTGFRHHTIPIQTKTKLQPFEHLIGTWIVSDSSRNTAGKMVVSFEQKLEFEMGLGGHIVHTKSYVKNKVKVWEENYHGVRFYDSDNQKLKFVEWSNTGTRTEGDVGVQGDSIWYTYDYQGLNFKDLWVKKDSNTYSLLIGSTSDGEWTKVYFEAKAERLME